MKRLISSVIITRHTENATGLGGILAKADFTVEAHVRVDVLGARGVVPRRLAHPAQAANRDARARAGVGHEPAAAGAMRPVFRRASGGTRELGPGCSPENRSHCACRSGFVSDTRT